MLWKLVTIALSILLLGLQYRLWVGQGSFAEIAALQRATDSQQIDNQELATRNLLLEVEVADLKEGFDTVEEIAREELGMIRDGEAFYLLVEEQ